ncbi:MAG: nucleotidyltransferase [Phycisphaerae bacterium]|nr:nucleotidyltransferase [Phycisphaerae bacterium]
MQARDLQIDKRALGDVCETHQVARLELFGSFASGEAEPGSHVDILVTFKPDARIGLEFVALKQDIERLIGRPVDLLARRSVEQSPSKYFRHYALRDTDLLYERS